MKVKPFRKPFVLALAAILFALVATENLSVAPQAQESNVTAIIENHSTESVHIYAAGGIFGPDNRLAPGQTREVRVSVPPDGRVMFYAVLDGQVLATGIWDGDPEHPDRFPRVAFTGPGKLLVTTGLR